MKSHSGPPPPPVVLSRVAVVFLLLAFLDPEATPPLGHASPYLSVSLTSSSWTSSSGSDRLLLLMRNMGTGGISWILSLALRCRRWCCLPTLFSPRSVTILNVPSDAGLICSNFRRFSSNLSASSFRRSGMELILSKLSCSKL